MLLRFFLVSKRSKGALQKTIRNLSIATPRVCLPLRNEEDGLELELTLDGEVLDSQVLLPVVGQALVESSILLSGDVLRVARPDGLRLVQLFILNLLLLDLLRLLRLFLVINLLDFGLLAFLFFILDFLVILDLLNIECGQYPRNA